MPAIRGQNSKKKTRRYTRAVDEIHADIHEEGHLQHFKNTKATEDLPGLGQWYCTECAKWFESEHNFTAHKKGGTHKRMVKQLKKTPYSQKEAEAAGGLGTHDFYQAKEQEDEKRREDDGLAAMIGKVGVQKKAK